MTCDLGRLFAPKSIALIGGAWAANAVEQLQRMNFTGEIWPVNPSRKTVHGLKCFSGIEALPGSPDAAFVGVNREASIGIVKALADLQCGGAVCFASGFAESEDGLVDGMDMQRQLVEAAGAMPLLGPNCYGFVNGLEGVALWPDQHGLTGTDRGVAILTQSSNIAINLTMQKRGLPLAFIGTGGNQAIVSLAKIALHLLEDDRITAIGMYLEGLGDIREMEALAARAHELGKAVVVLKIGKSGKARAATMTHTASLAGSSAAASALFTRLGFVEVDTLEAFIEALKIANALGLVRPESLFSLSCSGGEAALVADAAARHGLHLRDFSPRAEKALGNLLGPRVAITNPLDYHTYVWGETQTMTDVYLAAASDRHDLGLLVLDMPRDDRCDPQGYQCAVDALCHAVKDGAVAPIAVLTTLAENMPEALSSKLLEQGILTLHGVDATFYALAAFASRRGFQSDPVLLVYGGFDATPVLLDEQASKQELAAAGVTVPRSRQAGFDDLEDACTGLSFPLALKGLGLAHKSEAGAVRLGIENPQAVRKCAEEMKRRADLHEFLLEEMVQDGVCELIVGVTRDESGLLLLTIGAGGILAELLEDTASMVLPVAREEIGCALASLKANALLEGWRGASKADRGAILDAIQAIARYAEAERDHLAELDVNPLLCTRDHAWAVDALICISGGEG